MIEIKEALKQIGCTKEEIECAIQAITNINGDHLKLYQSINTLCKAQDDLNHTRSMIAQLGLTEPVKPVKRPYVRKSAPASLIDKSGVGAASESLKEQSTSEQAKQLREADQVLDEMAFAGPSNPKKRQQRKKETEAEIKNNVGDLGQVVLTKEEAAANLTIDL